MPRQPNVLWIQTDELRADALGCYGQSRYAAPRTPNIDTLAARGVLFENTYCTSPVCVPSRTSMLTGRYPHELGVYHNEPSVNGHVLPGDLATFPQTFASRGYDTVNMGKIHTPRNPTWQRVLSLPKGQGGYRDKRRGAPLRADTPGPPHVTVAGIYELEPGEKTPTTHLTETALDWLDAEANGATPWLLRVSYLMPHTPVMPPQRFANMFNPADFAFDEALDAPDGDMSPFEQWVAEFQQGGELPPDQIALARAHYWAVMAHVDDEVGRVFGKLDDLGLTDNTIVVFDADHGTMLGELGLWQKQMYNRTIHRVPQIMSCPGVLPEGEVREDLNDLLDRAPTLYGLCGIPRPAGIRGRDLFGDEPAPEAVYSIINAGQPDSIFYPLAKSGPVTPRRACVRTRTHRYDASVRFQGEDLAHGDLRRQPCLIDVDADHQERVNVSGRSEYSEVEQRLATLLEDFLSLDAGTLEPPLEP